MSEQYNIHSHILNHQSFLPHRFAHKHAVDMHGFYGSAMLNVIFHTSCLSYVCEEFTPINHTFANVTYKYGQLCDFDRNEFFKTLMVTDV